MDSRLWVALCRFTRDQIEVFNEETGGGAGQSGSPPSPEDPLEFSRFCVYLAIHHLDFPVRLYDDAITEGRGELGLDGVVVALGNQPLVDEASAGPAVEEMLESLTLFDDQGRPIPGAAPRPRILLVQVKREHITPVRELDHFGASADRFLTLGYDRFQALRPNPEVDRWRRVYDTVAAIYARYGLPFEPEIELIFAYAGIWRKDLAPDVARETAEKRIREHFGPDRVNFRMWGADELIEAIEWASKAVDGELKDATLIPLPEGPASGYMGHAPAKSIVDLIPDQDGRPDDRVFIDNVRAFLGDNDDRAEKRNPGAVGLRLSLEKGEGNQVLLRHNGITIVAREAELNGDGVLVLREFQIVNGGQTAHVLYRNQDLLDGVSLGLKIVVTEDDEIKNGVILGANTQSLVNQYDMLARRSEVRSLQQAFDAVGWSRPEKIWLQRRRREWIPKDGYANHRYVTPRNLMEAFTAALLQAPHRVHSDSGSLLQDVPDKIFHADQSPSAYRAMGWLVVTGRRWAETQEQTWIDYFEARGSRAYPARHQYVYALWLLVDPGPADSGLSRTDRKVTERFESVCRLLAGPRAEAFGKAAGEIVVEACDGKEPSATLVRTKDFTEKVRERSALRRATLAQT